MAACSSGFFQFYTVASAAFSQDCTRDQTDVETRALSGLSRDSCRHCRGLLGKLFYHCIICYLRFFCLFCF